MKKFLSIALIAIITISLFIGCTQKSNNVSKITQKIKIGVCLTDFDDKFWTYTLNEMKNYSKSLNDVEVMFVDAKNDSNIQLLQVEDFIAQRVDAIIVNPVDIDSSKPITDKAKAAKIPIISINSPFLNQSDASSYIGSEPKRLGILEMEYLAKKINFKGNVAVIMGKMGSELQRLRTEGYREVIAKYPDMEIVVEQTADWNRARAMALMQTWLESGKEIDVVACNSDEMAIGALKAIEEAGKLGEIVVGGIDATPDALVYLKSGKLSVTVFQDGAGQAQESINTAIKLAKGEEVEKIITTESELVTPEDVDKYIAKWKKKY